MTARLLALSLPLAGALAAGCALLPGDVSESGDGSDGPTGATRGELAASPSRARELLDELTTIERHPEGLPAYHRDAFGSAWADLDDNGCNQRDDVLLRDAEPGVVTQQQGACDHDVLAGTWHDPYTGATLSFDDLKDPRQAQAIQIDHVVPLAEAWTSGAAAWSDERRASYANDLANLLAVDGPTNAAKGAGDPAAWRPRQAHQCAYAIRWTVVKHDWELAADPSEVTALGEMLDTCPEPSATS